VTDVYKEVDLLNVMTFVNRYGIISYIVTVVLAIIFNMTGLEIMNITVSNVLNILYFIVLICAILSFYKSKNRNNQSLLFISLPIFLLFTGINFKVISTIDVVFPLFFFLLFTAINLKVIITMGVVFPLFFFEGINQARRIIGILIYLIFIILGILGLSIGKFGSVTVIDQQYSPDKIHKLVTIDSDMGALGGDTYIKLEGIYFEIFKSDIKTLYHGHVGEKPKVIWINNDIININGRDMNIHTSATWENKK